MQINSTKESNSDLYREKCNLNFACILFTSFLVMCMCLKGFNATQWKPKTDAEILNKNRSTARIQPVKLLEKKEETSDFLK